MAIALYDFCTSAFVAAGGRGEGFATPVTNGDACKRIHRLRTGLGLVWQVGLPGVGRAAVRPVLWTNEYTAGQGETQQRRRAEQQGMGIGNWELGIGDFRLKI